MCSPLRFILNSNAALRCGEGWCIIHAITSDVERGLVKASRTYSKTSMAILCVPQPPTPSTYIPNQFIPKSYLTPQPKPPSTIIQPSEVLLRCQSYPPPNHRSVARPRHTHACRGATPWELNGRGFAKAPSRKVHTITLITHTISTVHTRMLILGPRIAPELELFHCLSPSHQPGQSLQIHELFHLLCDRPREWPHLARYWWPCPPSWRLQGQTKAVPSITPSASQTHTKILEICILKTQQPKFQIRLYSPCTSYQPKRVTCLAPCAWQSQWQCSSDLP